MFSLAISTFVLLTGDHPFQIDLKLDTKGMMEADWSYVFERYPHLTE